MPDSSEPQISEGEYTKSQGNLEKQIAPSDEAVRGIFNKYKKVPKVQELVGLYLWLRNGSIEDIPDNSFVANLGRTESIGDEYQRFSLMTDDEKALLERYDVETGKMVQQQVVAKFKEEIPWIQRLAIAESAVPNDATVVDHPLLSAQKVGITDQVLTNHGLAPEEIDDRTDNITAVARREMHVRHTNLDENPPLKKDEGEVGRDTKKINMQLRAELMRTLVWETQRDRRPIIGDSPDNLVPTTAIVNGDLVPAWDVLNKRNYNIDRITGLDMGFSISQTEGVLEQYKKYWCDFLGKGEPADGILKFNLHLDRNWEMFRARLYLAGIDQRDYLRTKRSRLVTYDSANDLWVTHSMGKPEAGDDPEFESKREIGEVIEGSLPRTALLHFESGVIVDNLAPVVKPEIKPEHSASVALPISINQGKLQRLPQIMGMRTTQVRVQDGLSLLTDNEGNFYIHPQENISVANVVIDVTPDVSNPYDITSIQVQSARIAELTEKLQNIGLGSMAKQLSQIKGEQSLATILAKMEPYFVYSKKGQGNQTKEISEFSDVMSFVKNGKVYGVCSLYANFAEQIVRVLLPDTSTSFLHGFIATGKRIETPSHVQLGIDVEGEQKIIDITPSRRVLPEQPKKWLTSIRRVMHGGSRGSQKPELKADSHAGESQISEPIKAVDIIAIPPPKPPEEKHAEVLANNVINIRQLLVRRFNLPDFIVDNDPTGLLMKRLVGQSKDDLGRQTCALLMSAESARTTEQIEVNQVEIRKQRKILQQWKDADLATRARLQKSFGNWSERELSILDEMLASLEN